MAIRSSPYEDEFLRALTDPNEAAAYVEAARKDSRDSFLMALKDVAQAHKMARIAEEAEIERASLYRMLSVGGNPTLENFDAVLNAVGLTYKIVPLVEPESSATDNSSGCLKNTSSVL